MSGTLARACCGAKRSLVTVETQQFYTEDYEARLLRGIEDPRPWHVQVEVERVLHKHQLLLDIGSGTASKTIGLAPLAAAVVGVEPNPRMRRRAIENVRDAGLTNLHIVGGVAEALPFTDESFDVAVAMLAPTNAREVSRVLKPDGWAIIENIGERDKHNIKLEFPPDEEGVRGRYTSMNDGDRYRFFEKEYEPWFSFLEIYEGLWGTYYSPDGLLIMLEQTPAVRGFDASKDHAALRRVREKNMTSRGIRTLQHRLLVRARK
jgi:SAM-dependent methyltransferase